VPAGLGAVVAKQEPRQRASQVEAIVSGFFSHSSFISLS